LGRVGKFWKNLKKVSLNRLLGGETLDLTSIDKKRSGRRTLVRTTIMLREKSSSENRGGVTGSNQISKTVHQKKGNKKAAATGRDTSLGEVKLNSRSKLGKEFTKGAGKDRGGKKKGTTYRTCLIPS